MFRQLLAAIVTASVFVAAPAVLAPAVPTTHAVAFAAKAVEKPEAAKKRIIPHNKKVGLNPDTKVFHDKTCRFYTKKVEVMSAKEAKAKGGTPCKVCLK